MQVPRLAARGSAAMNMTPMIDVVFLLIIFFLVSSQLVKQEVQVKVDLPSASTGVDDSSSRPITTIHVLADGSWQMGGEAYDEARLIPILRQRNRETEGQLRIRIRTDQNVPYERVSPLLLACAKAGVIDIVFAVYEAKK